MFKRKYRVFLFAIALAAVVFLPAVEAVGSKNVIFFIGDGMGTVQRRIAELVYGRKLAMNSLAVTGLYTTHSANSVITDSAAAATAMATGHKVDNGVISIALETETAYLTLAEAAKKLGKSVGLVTTTTITHATPASFAAHVKSRDMENEIAEQYLTTGFEVYMGGGKSFFIPQDAAKRQPRDKQTAGFREDQRDLLKDFSKRGYKIIRTRAELSAASKTKTSKVLALFTGSHFPFSLDRSDSIPDLAEMTKFAISVLKQNQNGFFLMVEGGRIDHAAHGNAPVAVIAEVMDFDQAVRVGIGFLKQNPETLILVGADHETGGMSVGVGGGFFMNPQILKNVTKSEIWMGYTKVLNSPDLAEEIFIKYSGISDLTEQEKAAIAKVVGRHKKWQDSTDPQKIKTPAWFAQIFSRIISLRARVGWATRGHTGVPILLSSSGPGAEKFSGYFDNTDIAKKIFELWGINSKTKQ